MDQFLRLAFQSKLIGLTCHGDGKHGLCKGPLAGCGRVPMLRVRRMLRLVAAAAGLTLSLPALASPLEAPTVDYTQDIVVTRPSDHAFKKPERIVFGGRHIRIDSVG